jgi:hypothetical protein
MKPTIHPPALLTRYAELWNAVSATSDAARLQKLQLLREFSSELHAGRSIALASGQQEWAEQMLALESSMMKLRKGHPLTGSLQDCLARPDHPVGISRSFSPDFEQAVGTEPFERFDRTWEKALALEALQIGWRFWALDAWVMIQQADQFHRSLGASLGTRGIVLFVEGTPGRSASSPSQGPMLWPGRWWIVLESGLDPLNLELADIPGLSLSHEGLKWNLLFPPR